MKFNVAKCHSMRVTRHYSHKQILHDNTLHQQTLENVQSAKYLGTLYNNHSLSENRDWGQHFDTVPHKHLLKKLKLFGLTGNELKWMKYFLSGANKELW